MWNDPWRMKVIITFTFCHDNPWKSIVFGSGKSLENSGNFFSYFVVTLSHYLKGDRIAVIKTPLLQ